MSKSLSFLATRTLRIAIEFNEVFHSQFPEWSDLITELWKKYRGFLNWPSRLELNSIVERQLIGQTAVVTQWNLSMMRGWRVMILFLFSEVDRTCEVFLSSHDQIDEPLATTIKEAHSNLSPVSTIDDF